MKNCSRYIICAISLSLTLSLIFDAFADDHRYRKKHGYRGGSEKSDDDNDDPVLVMSSDSLDMAAGAKLTEYTKNNHNNLFTKLKKTRSSNS